MADKIFRDAAPPELPKLAALGMIYVPGGVSGGACILHGLAV